MKKLLFFITICTFLNLSCSTLYTYSLPETKLKYTSIKQVDSKKRSLLLIRGYNSYSPLEKKYSENLESTTYLRRSSFAKTREDKKMWQEIEEKWNLRNLTSNPLSNEVIFVPVKRRIVDSCLFTVINNGHEEKVLLGLIPENILKAVSDQNRFSNFTEKFI